VYNFKSPIPGESLTKELGNYPWEQPAQFDTVEDALDDYLELLQDEDTKDNLFNMMEMGVPLDILVEATTMQGTMRGKHTLDVSYLLNPMLHEYLKAMADIMKIDYIDKISDLDKGTKAKEQKEKARLANLIQAELKGATAKQIKEDGGLTLMQQVEDTLEQGETIEPKESDIEMSVTPSGELEPPRKGLMGKVN
tara:strand:+ start:2724 stop:3308 length:585 start_codon:yes stop_codon:yes gene_type:complete